MTKFLLLLIFLFSIPTSLQAGVQKITTDLLIVGGTESGWAAAIQAARSGVKSITIVHDGKWLGGQFTEQALACIDENKGNGKVGWGVDWHPMKRSFHRSGLFKELMDRIEDFNLKKYGATMPGRPFHGPSTCRPAEVAAIFREMLQPYIDSGQIKLILNRYPVQAEVFRTLSGPELKSLWFAEVGKEKNPDLHVRASMFIDASDWGDVIQISGTEFECGVDPQSRYGEPSAPKEMAAFPENEMNPITWPMIIVQSDSETPIAKPERFDDRCFVRSTKLSFEKMKDLKWDRDVRLYGIPHWPNAFDECPRQLSVFNVRRIVDGTTSKDQTTSILLCYMLGQDYPLVRLPKHVKDALEKTEDGASEKNIVLMNRLQRDIIFEDAKRHALCVLYHFQNFVHDLAGDKTNSFRNFKLSNEFGTFDSLPPKPYIRESLRLKAMYMMREQDGRNRDGETKDYAKERFAEVMYDDGIFPWQFHYDFHRTGRAYLDSEGNTGPWIDKEKPGRNTHLVSDRSVFPIRSLIPQKMKRLIGAQKNVGYSSIVSAAIRLHDQCIAIGQAAGATAAVSLRHDIPAQKIPYSRKLLESVRNELCNEKQAVVPMLLWPYRDLSPEHADFVVINRLSAMGALPRRIREVDFMPNARADLSWVIEALEQTSDFYDDFEFELSSLEAMTRAEFSQLLWKRIQEQKILPFERIKQNDADADGIPDSEDPSLFTAKKRIEW